MFISGWISVQREVFIEFDLESVPLQIKTDSLIGSNKQIQVIFYDENYEPAGGFNVKLTSTPQYYISYCSSDWKNFPGVLPTETEKVWRISLTRNPDITLTVHCNDVEILDNLLSSLCDHGEWSTAWSRIKTQIKFTATIDAASKFYFRNMEPGKRSIFTKNLLILNQINFFLNLFCYL